MNDKNRLMDALCAFLNDGQTVTFCPKLDSRGPQHDELFIWAESGGWSAHRFMINFDGMKDGRYDALCDELEQLYHTEKKE